MPGSLTTPGRTDARTNASVHVVFRKTEHVDTRDFQAFAAQWLAYALPYRRFAVILADANARLGANADCYSFIAVDFHHLLFAGFYRRRVCLARDDYANLSTIARAITGTRWNGPRFFGLRSGAEPRASSEAAKVSSAPDNKRCLVRVAKSLPAGAAQRPLVGDGERRP
jgi:hypothetical protein